MRLNILFLSLGISFVQLVNAEESFTHNKLLNVFPQYESQLICKIDIERRMELLSLLALLSANESKSYIDMYERGGKGHGFEGMTDDEIGNYIKIVNFFITDKEKELHDIRADCIK